MLASLHDQSCLLTLIPSFGATSALVFAHPESPFARPTNVVCGHLVSSLVGLIVLPTLGTGPLALAAGVGLAIAAMIATRTMHPPAGGDPLVVILTGASPTFLIEPILIGSVALLAIAIGYHAALGNAYGLDRKQK